MYRKGGDLRERRFWHNKAMRRTRRAMCEKKYQGHRAVVEDV